MFKFYSLRLLNGIKANIINNNMIMGLPVALLSIGTCTTGFSSSGVTGVGVEVGIIVYYEKFIPMK